VGWLPHAALEDVAAGNWANDDNGSRVSGKVFITIVPPENPSASM